MLQEYKHNLELEPCTRLGDLNGFDWLLKHVNIGVFVMAMYVIQQQQQSNNNTIQYLLVRFL